jgi:hypothetical protein
MTSLPFSICSQRNRRITTPPSNNLHSSCGISKVKGGAFERNTSTWRVGNKIKAEMGCVQMDFIGVRGLVETMLLGLVSGQGH